MMHVKDTIYQSKLLYSLIGGSVLYFLIKGCTYVLIGSYLPMLFVLIIILTLWWSLKFSIKRHRLIIKTWAIFIIAWALIRLGLWLVLQIDGSMTESHLREQLGLVQHFVSLLMLAAGYGIIRQLKNSKGETRVEKKRKSGLFSQE